MAMLTRVMKNRILRQRWLVPIVSTIFLYLLGYGIPALFFGIYIKPERIPADFGLQLALALLVFAVSRRIWAFLLLQTLLIGVLYVGSAVKTAILGRPIMPEDMHNVSALIEILGTKGWLFVGLPLAAIIALFVFNLRIRGRATLVAWAILIALPVAAAAGPQLVEQTLDKAFNNFPWDQRQNYIYRGGTINFVQESVRAVAEARPAPNESDVRNAVARRELASGPRVNLADQYASAGDPSYRHKRNIHIVLEESFWDPDLLTAAHFNVSPMDPRFMALWKQTGYSHGLSPAFGGQTANAEFEILCGFPINEVAVKFEYGLKNNVPCLPRLLDQIGYRTIASHPNLPAFWNRQVAFKLLGFQTFWAGTDFKMDDLSGNQFLSDKSLHAQVAAKLAADRANDPQRPVLDYIVSIFGHWPYPPSDNRPDVVTSDTKVPEVVNYANAVYYKSREMMDEIERLRRTDPDSLIIVFGDHLPTLGAKFGGFTESGVLADSFGGFTADMYMFSAATPLIVIDGRNGPLHVGSLPMYRVPRLVMDLIGEDGPTIFDLAAPPAHTAPRPLPGVLLDHRDAAADSLCVDHDTQADCPQMNAWLSDVQLISHDIFSGHENAVRLLDGRAIAGGSTIGAQDANGQSPDLQATPANADLPTDGSNANAIGFKPDAVQPAGNR